MRKMVTIQAEEQSIIGSYRTGPGETPDHVETFPEVTAEGNVIAKRVGMNTYKSVPEHSREMTPNELAAHRATPITGAVVADDGQSGRIILMPAEPCTVPEDILPDIAARKVKFKILLMSEKSPPPGGRTAALRPRVAAANP